MEGEERVLLIIKPDAIQRGLMGEIVSRFERKGFKIIGTKMERMGDILLDEHYAHIANKPFFKGIKDFMMSAPVILMAVSGINGVKAARLITGPTDGSIADAGTIRGDMSLSIQSNLIHTSDSVENGKIEVDRFFSKEELFDYEQQSAKYIYADKHF
ncbi:MAG: nucleoside-diphosphate kinase [Patescibacteria group bacterium]